MAMFKAAYSSAALATAGVGTSLNTPERLIRSQILSF